MLQTFQGMATGTKLMLNPGSNVVDGLSSHASVYASVQCNTGPFVPMAYSLEGIQSSLDPQKQRSQGSLSLGWREASELASSPPTPTPRSVWENVEEGSPGRRPWSWEEQPWRAGSSSDPRGRESLAPSSSLSQLSLPGPEPQRPVLPTSCVLGQYCDFVVQPAWDGLALHISWGHGAVGRQG